VRRPDRPQARRAGSRAAVAGRWAGLAALLLCGCARSDSPAERALAELEELAFVPAGRVPLGAFVPLVLIYECPAPLLVDRFEATIRQWREFAVARPGDVSKEMLARIRSWDVAQQDLPATWMTLAEAQRFAQWRGMRLLEPGEWLFAALGRERRSYPHGDDRQDSVANTLDLGLGRLCPVGTFEGGRTPGQVYDLLGNVAEWVSGDVLASLMQGANGAPSPDAEREVSALGGSFRTWLRPIFRLPLSGEPAESPFLAYTLHPQSRQDDIGLRCATPAQDYLERNAARWGRDEEALKRLKDVGERWGRSAVPLLRELAARDGAAPGLEALLEGARR
jgi:formylglycine-generating enzyme required for sulfatase activity